MTEKFNVDDDSVRGLAKLLEETGLTEIEYQVGTHRIRVVRSNVSVVSHAVPAPSHSASVKETSPMETPIVQGETVKSPMVGTVYLSAEPGAAAFIKTGDLVKKGDTLLIIEAMKVMNPIRAPRDGKVLSICIENAKPVEFDEPLLILE
ncbi:acetyl-CoA carboxylase biotin carboxyl carrier protein subunit [Geitlerinema splendidum]|jgi:acetyl-CoA carboxylase biotin carboxyl carrier protein|nr:acetyl-CoA carboxylase biotin carboxyl carrier protein subunit [Geitlerinema splendidum]